MCELKKYVKNNVISNKNCTSETFSCIRASYVKKLTLRLLMSYIYMEHPFLMFLDHT